MTMVRTALRLCVAEALRGATIAGERVYDSRPGDFSPDSMPEDALPTIIVLTDKDEGEALSEQNGGPPFRRMVDVVFELALIQRITIETLDEDGNVTGSEFDVMTPDTDKRHEAALDLLEFQVKQCLSSDPVNPLSIIFRRLARVKKYDCHRQITDEAGVKIAARLLTWSCDITDDKMTIYASGAVPTGLAVIPEPLRTVALALPENSEGLAICQGIAAAISTLSVAPLSGIDVVVDASRSDQGGSDLVEFDIETAEP